MCQRYYQQTQLLGFLAGIGQGTTKILSTIHPLACALRASPTLTVSGTAYYLDHDTYTTISGAGIHASTFFAGQATMGISFDGLSTVTDNRLAAFDPNIVTYDAEL